MTSAQFTDVTSTSGILHRAQSPEFTGGGVAFFDYNNDGWQDIFLCGGERPDKLYVNLNGDGFADSSHLVNIGPNWNTAAVNVGDFNNDGWSDILLATYENSQPSFILASDGNGSYERHNLTAGIDGFGSSVGSLLTDINGDGLLDIYLINYIAEIEFILDSLDEVIGYAHDCQVNFYYENQGDLYFVEKASEMGLSARGCGFTGVELDLESDRGLYVVNDFGEWLTSNEYLVRDTTGKYTNGATSYMLDYPLYGMGVAVADMDGDFDLDLYLTDIGSNAYLENVNGVFEERAELLGIDASTTNDGNNSTSWGALYLDFDNDQDQDLYVANGFIAVAPFLQNSLFDENRLYENRSQEGMTDISFISGMDHPRIHRGAAKADIDHDGDQDILIGSIDGSVSEEIPDRSARLYRNDHVGNNYLKLHLGTSPFVSAQHPVMIKVYTEVDSQLIYHYSGGSHASSSSAVAHIGLGSHDQADSIHIVYQAGAQVTLRDIESNKTLWIDADNERVFVMGCTDSNDPYYNPEAEIHAYCKSELSTRSRDVLAEGCNRKSIAISDREPLDLILYTIDGIRLPSGTTMDSLPAGIYLAYIEDDYCRRWVRYVKY